MQEVHARHTMPQQQATAHLEVLTGSDRGTSCVLTDEALLGRGPESALRLSENGISRRHARIVQQGAQFVLEDLNSMNGVILRGTRIQPQTPYALQDGDEIQICSTRFVFHDATPQPPAPPAPEEPPPVVSASEPQQPEPAAAKEFGSLTVAMVIDDPSHRVVAVALDASESMLEVQEDEKHSDKGLQDALKRLQIMCQVSTALGTITDWDKLLQKIVDFLFEIFPLADYALIMLHDQDSDVMEPAMVKARHTTPGQPGKVTVSRTIMHEVTTHKRSILSMDALDDRRFSDHSSVFDLSIRSMMCAPLLTGEELLGFIQVDTRTGQRSFTSADLQMLTGISAQAAVALKNLQLHATIEAEVTRRTSLQRYFCPKLVEMLMSGDVTTALGGRLYTGTILFADIIGFTAMSEKMSPAQVMTRLNRYLSLMQTLIYAHGGNVDKFSGDGIMAFWGVPRPGPQDEADAVRAALYMQEKLWFFNLQLKAEEQQLVHMGIGLNTGEFIAGNIGSEDKIEFTLLGDTVNLAARLQELAGRYQVFISEATWEPLQHLVCAVRLPPMVIRGKSQPVTIYSVRGIQDSSRGGCALALPCYLLDAQERRVGHGIITGSSDSSTGRRLAFSSPTLLAAGDPLTLQLAMPGYHESLVLTCTVEASSRADYSSTYVYTQATLLAAEGEAAMAFLTPGSCLVTAHAWDRLKRV